MRPPSPPLTRVCSLQLVFCRDCKEEYHESECIPLASGAATQVRCSLPSSPQGSGCGWETGAVSSRSLRFSLWKTKSQTGSPQPSEWGCGFSPSPVPRSCAPLPGRAVDRPGAVQVCRPSLILSPRGVRKRGEEHSLIRGVFGGEVKQCNDF